MIQYVRNREIDHQGNERTQHDEVRGIGKAFEDFAAVAGGAAYPATKLDFVLPETASFAAASAIVREPAKHLAHLLTIHIVNKEADNRTFVFYDGNPGGAAGTFKQLLPTITVLAGSGLRLNVTELKGYSCTFDLYVDPSGNKTNGVEVSVSALIINKEVAE